ncbi:MAG: glycoside hydrolase family 97 catalytic domain-containing protein [Oscillospiraceae bacterium]|nr:glycoside hydrolase family 97 catalytic domain-containing protein [Oscillospiraceae bacterium]
MKKILKRAAAAAAAGCLMFHAAAGETSWSGLFGHDSSFAAANYQNSTVASQGNCDRDAIIRGGSANVVFDSDIDSNVLHIGGDSFGSGWLELPQFFDDGVNGGFTISMKFRLDGDAENYTRLFQMSSIPFGTGNTQGYNSPDISIDLNRKESFRSSLFVGKTQKTADDGAHRSIFNVLSKPDTLKWHDLTISYSPEEAAFYIDQKRIALENDDDLESALKSIFNGNMLASYIYNSIGHSLYTDNDIKACVDDVAFYKYALTSAQAADLPDDPDYLYTFEPGTITENAVPPSGENTTSLSGAILTSVPELETMSPDKTLVTKIWTDAGGSYYYSVDKLKDGRSDTVIQPSKLGFVTSTEDLSSGFRDQSPSPVRKSGDKTYSMPNGKHCRIRDHFNEVSFPLIKGDSILTVSFRIYDDGVGFRYSLNHGASIKEESSEIVFPEKGTFWGNWPNATYEWEISEFSMNKIKDAWADYSVPFMGTVDDKYWVLVSEAAVINEETPYCAGCLTTVGGSRALKFKGGVKVKEISMPGSFHTPWRAVIIADNLNDMTSSDLILNLNPDSVIEDTSWIKPGKSAWSWWSSGGDSPIEYHNQKDYIDFAAGNHWDYVCLDFGWALWDESAAKVKELCEYAEEKGIGIFLWYGVNNTGHSGYKDSAGHPAYPYYSLLDEETIVREFERIKGLGVKGVKVDYYESDTQISMKQMHMCAEYAAENKLMVVFHGCTMPRGESRTYPNVVSHEAINGTEYYKWFNNPSLANRITYTYLRNTVGSADFTPTGVPVPGIAATAGFALADVVNIESGVQHFAQSVYTYEGNGALPFLNDVPVKWDDLRVIDGYPMKFNVTGRQSGNDWYIGAMTIDPRTIEIPLNKMITDDGHYTAYIFGDNADGSRIEVKVINDLTRNDVITHKLMANGGCAVKITRNFMKLTTNYSNYRFYEAEDARLAGKAAVSEGKYCSNNAYVGYVGGSGNSVTFDNVTVDKAGDYTLRIYYISGEPRSLQIGVNGAAAAKLDGLFANKNDWKGICAANVKVALKAGSNSIRLYNDSGYGPSIDRIALAIPNDDEIPGDVNADGKFNILDIVLMQCWLIGVPDIELANWENGDLRKDGVLNLIDFCLMKNELIKTYLS